MKKGTRFECPFLFLGGIFINSIKLGCYRQVRSATSNLTVAFVLVSCQLSIVNCPLSIAFSSEIYFWMDLSVRNFLIAILAASCCDSFLV